MPKSIPPTPSAPAAVGPYSAAAEAHGLVFVSGQLAIDPDTGERAPDDVISQTHQVMNNIGAILSDLGLGYSDIVRTGIFLADIADFAAVNEIYASHFQEAPPARSTVQVGALPGGFLVEIDLVVAR